MIRPVPTDPPENPRYWFPAKRYGWGWGIPVTWQGWIVLVAFIIAMLIAGMTLAAGHLILYLVTVAILVGVLIAICYAKGEPPRWRWG